MKIKRICLTLGGLFLAVIIFASGVILTIRLPETVMEIYYRCSFFHLDITKKLICEKIINGNSVKFYSDRFEGRPAKLLNEVYLYPILKEAYDEFENFLAGRHGLKKLDKKFRNSLTVTLVTKDRYAWRVLAHKNYSDAHTEFFTKKIYICSDKEFDVLKNKDILRHEVFHFLTSEYFLWELTPHKDAYDFGNLR